MASARLEKLEAGQADMRTNQMNLIELSTQRPSPPQAVAGPYGESGYVNLDDSENGRKVVRQRIPDARRGELELTRPWADCLEFERCEQARPMGPRAAQPRERNDQFAAVALIIGEEYRIGSILTHEGPLDGGRNEAKHIVIVAKLERH